MKINNEQVQKSPWYKSRVIIAIIFNNLILLFVFFLFIHDITFEYKDRLMYKAEQYLDKVWRKSYRNVSKITTKEDIKNLKIDIGYKNFKRLEYKRSQAIKTGVLISSDDDYVPAKLSFNDKVVDIEIRLKGDASDHFKTEKWSYRIKVKGNNTVLGMKKFSIQHPSTRNYIHEWIYHEALRKEDVIALRYHFVSVNINGDELGIFALEEAWDKRLIESNQRREGVIVKFNEDSLWLGYKTQLEVGLNRKPIDVSGTLEGSYVDVFSSKSIFEDEGLRKQFDQAKNMLARYKNGTLAFDKVFDVEKMARFRAVSQLVGGSHSSTVWNNWRFYLNPVTFLLEPIGFDGNSGQKINRVHLFHEENEEFVKAYYIALKKVSSSDFLDELFSSIQQELNTNLNILKSEFINTGFNRSIYEHNQKIIRYYLENPYDFHAYLNQKNQGTLELEIIKQSPFPVHILGLSLENEMISSFQKPVWIPRSNLLKGVLLDFPVSKNISEEDTGKIEVIYVRSKGETKRSKRIIPWSYLNKNFQNDIPIPQNIHLENSEFFIVDQQQKKIFFNRGKSTIRENVMIPRGYRVYLNENVEIDLIDKGKIISHSPVFINGSEDTPVKIYSSDNTGQGLAVLRANETSIIKHAIFDGLSNPVHANWSVTGAVTFYESPVEFSYCRFLNNRSEDSLNIIRSQFSIHRSIFENSMSDAFDGDFVQGSITNCGFLDCGNDAIDVSGASVDLKNIKVNSVGDKALSAGEDSTLKGEYISIYNVPIAIASKDGSKVMISNSKINKSQIAFTAYRKKPEFSFSSIEAKGTLLAEVEKPFFIEKGASMKNDDKVIPWNHEKIKDLMYGVQYGKKSK